MSERPAVNLDDLRIEETSRGSRGGRLLVIILLLLIPVAFALGWVFRGGSSGGILGGAVKVRTETVRALRAGRATTVGGLGEGGWIEVPSYHPIRVTALVSGRVEDLTVLEGSPVGVNDVIARLYSKDFEDALRKAEAAVLEAKATLDLRTAGYRKEDVEKARADVSRLAEELDLAKKVLGRTAGLVETGAASAEERERHEAAVDVAKARLEGARQDLARLEAGFRVEEIAQARATLARATAERDLARRRLTYCEVRSPVKGVVLERHVTPGTWLPAGNPLVVSLYDPNDLQVRVDVRLENASRVKVGQKAEVTTEAEPDRVYHGEVIRLEPLADFKKNTIQAKLRLTDAGPGLYPEMICHVRFLAEEKPSSADPAPRVLTVSASAVLTDEGRTFVYKVRDGRLVRSEVRTGAERDGRVVIESGLTEGETVVSAPTPGLADGTEVEVVSP